jgi:hypothetical protein
MGGTQDPRDVTLCVVAARQTCMRMAPLLRDLRWCRSNDTFLGAKLA